LPSTADSNLETIVYSWLQSARNDGKNFVTVFFAGSDKEGKVTDIVAKANTLKDETVVFVGNGVKNADGTQKPAPQYAQYIAGLIAGTPLDGSLTYVDVPYAETIYRFLPSDIKTLLAAGVLVTVTDGDTPRIEQGLTLGDQGTPFFKIRTVRAKQAMIDDIDSAVRDNYIGRITNNYDGQLAVINAIKVYLETLANANVIDQTYNVAIDKTIASVGAEMYVNIAVRYLDSIEFVYLTISV
jgi:hypothetical protein